MRLQADPMGQAILRADTSAELLAKIAELDIDVPPSSGGRRKHHAERYCIVHLLATLPVERFAFPLALSHSDKPDFLLEMRGAEVGIEHTEVVPENIALADFLRDKEGLGPDAYFTPHAVPGEAKKERGYRPSPQSRLRPSRAWPSTPSASHRPRCGRAAHVDQGQRLLQPRRQLTVGCGRIRVPRRMVVRDQQRTAPLDRENGVLRLQEEASPTPPNMIDIGISIQPIN